MAPEVQQAVEVALAQLDPDEAGKRLQLQISKKIALDSLSIPRFMPSLNNRPLSPFLCWRSFQFSLDRMEEMPW